MSVASLLDQGLEQLPVTLPEMARTGILNYLDLLEKWNKVHNLTAVRDSHEQVRLHVLDCLALLTVIDHEWESVADIGSGAGLPGIMLALARPQWPIFLVESNKKKVAFLREAVRQLGLSSVQVVAERAENWQPDKPIELILSRAVADVDGFLKVSAHLGDEKSCWGLMKAHDEACGYQDFVKEKVIELRVPLLDAPRLWIEVRR